MANARNARAASAADFTETNPWLGDGEERIEIDTGKSKIGPGYWNDLSYGAGQEGGGSGASGLLPGEPGTQIVADDGGVGYEFAENVPIFAFRAPGDTHDRFQLYSDGIIFGLGNVAPTRHLGAQKIGVTDASTNAKGNLSVEQSLYVGDLLNLPTPQGESGSGGNVAVVGGIIADPSTLTQSYGTEDVAIDLRDGSMWKCVKAGTPGEWVNSKWVKSANGHWWAPVVDNSGVITTVDKGVLPSA